MTEQTSSPGGSLEDREAREAMDSVGETMNRFIGTAHVSSVFGQPVQVGDTTIITTAEVLGGLGFGLGSGSGPEMEGGQAPSGSGGGGGGFVQARPVAVIIASPEGVRVEPVIDVAKIGLAALTAFGVLFANMARMQRRHLRLTR